MTLFACDSVIKFYCYLHSPWFEKLSWPPAAEEWPPDDDDDDPWDDDEDEDADDAPPIELDDPEDKLVIAFVNPPKEPPNEWPNELKE